MGGWISLPSSSPFRRKAMTSWALSRYRINMVIYEVF